MMMITKSISNSHDVIDIRDVIERVEELRDERDSWVLGDPDGEETPNPEGWRENNPDDAEELDALEALLAECAGNGGDHQWEGDWYPVTLIRDSYFEDYARQLAEDIGAVDRGASWPNNCIDWEKAANELQTDYTSVDFDGETYWYR